MLYEYLRDEFLYKEDWNCAEHILIAADKVYKLGLDPKAYKLAAAFGGGMATGENVCGALAAAAMVLGLLFVKERAHESAYLKKLTSELLERYKERMGSLDCKPLKDDYRTKDGACTDVILPAAQILDDIVLRELPGIATKGAVS